MEEKNWCIYKHTNKINDKIYIGITCQSPNHRWRNGKGYKAGYFKNAICRYGWDSFEHEVLEENLSEIDAKKKEKMFIRKYNSNNSDFGYNLTDGGEGTVGYNHTTETRNKMSERKKYLVSKGMYVGESNPFYGKAHTNETRNKMRKIWNRRIELSKNTECYVFTHEQRRNMGASHMKAVVCITTKMIFDSIKEAGEYFKFDSTHITRNCKNKSNSTHGLVFAYYNNEDVDDLYNKNIVAIEKAKTQYKKHERCGMATPVICDNKYFKSVSQLSNYTDVPLETIRGWLIGKRKMPQKYIDLGLRYATEEDLGLYKEVI